MRAIFVAALVLLAGCNTIEGLGQDISGAARGTAEILN
jgi:predicted small secreted protein